jgi:hypothetical protein
MPKGQNQKKGSKKKPLRTAKEKKQDKRDKKKKDGNIFNEKLN